MESYSHITPYLRSVEQLMESRLEAEDKMVYGLLVPFLRRGGKRIRPVLSLLSCGAVGGQYEAAIEPAAIIEMFHNFTLIHDDIEDDSQFRRGEPALQMAYGVPMALNSGDALYTLLWRELTKLKLRPAKLVALQTMYADAFKRVVDGQGVELSWIRGGRFDVSEDEYLAMIGGKTAALMGLSCEAGAFIGGAGKRAGKALRQYGESLGAAFQIQDDVLNVTGSFEKYQKEIGGDISEGKRTLMVVHCLSKAGEAERKRLMGVLSSHSRKQEDINDVIGLLQKHGSVEYARKRAASLVGKAKRSIARFPDNKDKTALLAIADYVIKRDR
ncbi:MAG: polyprenyl synthetase family protein [Candidatus ainarchaeum sp.]|nr:polyprenyl synthetase family protein [Candidatus ainarchaeum sp.]